MQYSFDIKIATHYGINVAIFLNNLAFWIQKNIANNKNYHDGNYWTYNSVEAYKTLFPFWSTKQVRATIDKCIKFNLIVGNNYNSNAYDRTKWYALTDLGQRLVGISICPKGQMDSLERTNGFVQKGEPIPDINTDIKPERGPLRKKRATSLPDDFVLNAKNLSLCKQRGLDPLGMICKFRANAIASGKKALDWHAAAELWILNEKENKPSTNKIISPLPQQPYSAVNKMDFYVSEKNILRN